jgi:uncharacterized SAM-binding protein YcdF (DUF218 family)
MYGLINYLLHPYTLFFILAWLGVANLWRKRSEGRARWLLLTLPLGGLTLLSTPLLSDMALGSLEWQYPPLADDPVDASAIVVLSGGISLPNARRSRAELNSDSVYRCLHAAEVYRRGPPRLVVVSGGKVDPSSPGPTLAEAMRGFLAELGVRNSDLVIEDKSRTTYENAVESGRLLKERGVTKIILVTGATHMPRALAVFRGQGIETSAAPCHFRAAPFEHDLYDFLPSPSAARGFQDALHEWIGIIWYRLHGRM